MLKDKDRLESDDDFWSSELGSIPDDFGYDDDHDQGFEGESATSEVNILCTYFSNY